MDKLKLYPQERLDLVDINDIQALVYAYAQKSLGNLMGGMRGLLSRPLYTFVNGTPDKIQLSDFSFISTKAIGNAAGTNSIKVLQESQVVHFDSTLADHGNYPIDLTGVDNTMFLWVRPLMVDMDSANRRKWDVAQGTEVTFNDNTRTRMRCEFAFSATDPTSEEDEYQYSQIAKVASITGSSIILSFISAFDNASIADTIGETGTFYDSLSTTTTAFSGLLGLFSAYDAQNEYNQGLGFAQIVHILARALRQHKFEGVNDPVGTSKTVPWYNQPLLSLNGAYKYLTNHDTDINQIILNNVETNNSLSQIRTDFYELYPRTIFSCVIQGNPLKEFATRWTLETGSARNISAVAYSYQSPYSFYIKISDLLLDSDHVLESLQITQSFTNTSTLNLSGLNRVNCQPVYKGNYVLSNSRYTYSFASFPTGQYINIYVLPWQVNDEDHIQDSDYNYLDNLNTITLLITGIGRKIGE